MAEFFVSAGDEFKSPERLEEFFLKPDETIQRVSDNPVIFRPQDNSSITRP
jgi:hypothetical protein